MPSSKSKPAQLQIAHYSADVLGHVCPVVRVTGPAQMVGWPVIHGVEWEGYQSHIFPERVANADLVIIQRDFPRHFEAYQAVMAQAREHGKKVVYELDDLLTELPEAHPDYGHYRKSRANILTAVCEADAVVCSTPGIRDYLYAFNPNIFIFPNYLDDTLWPLRSGWEQIGETPNRPLMLGYLGSHSHMQDLETVVPVLERLLDRHADGLRLQLWGIGIPPGLSECPNVDSVIPGLVNYAEFAAYFGQQDCDIFIAPLIDNQFNRCKSAIKYLEYGASGVPGVYSRLAPYSSVVKHGENGYLASSLDEWEASLTMLIETPELRRRMGAAASETIRAEWLLSNHTDQWTSLYLNIPNISRKNVHPAPTLVNKMQVWQDEYETNLDQRGRQIGELQEDLDRQSLEIAGYQEQLEQRSNEVSRLRHELLRINSLVAGSITQVNQLEGQIQSLNEQVMNFQGQVSQLTEINKNQNDEIVRQEQKISGLTAAIEEKDKLVEMYNSTILAIHRSTGWKLLELLYKIRLTLIPRNSAPERWLRSMLHSGRILKNEGARAWLGSWRSKPPAPLPTPSVIPPPQFSARPEITRCPSPAISVVIQATDLASAFDSQAVLDWAARQTLKSVEVVQWDRMAGIAAVLSSGNESNTPRSWGAGSVKQLCQGLPGRYLCMASADLLQHNTTYLETNLVALESESLVFTINSLGSADEPIQALHSGRIPGSQELPLVRQVVRKEYVSDDLSLDLETWLSGMQGIPAVAGKLIIHTTEGGERQPPFPLDAPIGKVEVQLQGRNILARTRNDLSWNAPLTALPVDLVLPESPGQSGLPTVIMVMPFLAVGGAEQLAINLIKGLKNDIRFIILAAEELDPALGTLSDAFRELTPYVYNMADFLNPHLRTSFLWYLIERFHPSSIYIANGTAWIYDILPQIKRRYPDLRTINQVYDSQAGWINRYDVNLVMNMDGHIGANRKICLAYQERGARPEQVHLIEHCVDLAGLDPENYSPEQAQLIRANLGLPETGKIVTFASRQHPQKRPMDFIELARRFEREPDVFFLMVGDGPLAGALNDAIRKAGVKKIIRKPFYRPISNILAITDVLVLPSEYEGHPLIVAEAQVMGKPVVVTDVGNNRDVLEITHGGILTSMIGDVEGLASGVRQMLANPPEPHAIRSAYISNFGDEVILKKYRHVLIGA